MQCKLACQAECEYNVIHTCSSVRKLESLGLGETKTSPGVSKVV